MTNNLNSKVTGKRQKGKGQLKKKHIEQRENAGSWSSVPHERRVGSRERPGDRSYEVKKTTSPGDLEYSLASLFELHTFFVKRLMDRVPLKCFLQERYQEDINRMYGNWSRIIGARKTGKIKRDDLGVKKIVTGGNLFPTKRWSDLFNGDLLLIKGTMCNSLSIQIKIFFWATLIF